MTDLEARLPRADRREALLDVAAELVAAGDIDQVTMDTVAERAGVSRPLVYKHFANRAELLAAVYQREAELLHEELAAQVGAATTIEEMFRALAKGALRAQARRGAAYAALHRAGARTKDRRYEQRERDRTTLAFFARRAVKQFGLEDRAARAGVGILLGGIDTVINTWRHRPTPEHAELLENTYAALAVGGLNELARRRV
jgi:AcrR family transcriptional regulator